MRTRDCIVAAVLFLAITTLAPTQEQNRQAVIPVDDPAYTYLDLLLLGAGLPQSSSFRPFTAEEFAEYVELLPVGQMSGTANRLLQLLVDRLHPAMLVNRAGGMGISGGIESNLEYYAKADLDSDYIFSSGDRLPMLSIPLELWFFDTVYATSVVTLREDYRLTAGRWEPIVHTRGETSPAPVNRNSWNVVSLENNVLELDWYFPTRALISLGGPHWHLTYGRDSMNVGNGSSGNLLLSDFPDYYDSFALSTHWRSWKGVMSYIYLEPWLTPDDVSRLNSGEYFMRLRDYGDPYKALVLHLLEFRPFVNRPRLPQVTIFAAEALMFGSQYPQIRDFNPFMIFHNWFEYERSNDSFLIGFNVVPVPRLELYGEYFLNEFDTSYESGNNYPGAAGWLGGVRVMHAAPFGVFSGYAEYVLTDPLLYNRYHPLLKFVSRRRIWTYFEPDQMIYADKPIGYYTGPDTEVVSVGLSYLLPPDLEARAQYSFITKGEKDTESAYAEVPGEATPTGTPWQSHVVQLGAEYTPLPIVSVGADVYFVFDSNLEHEPGIDRSDIQAAVHVTVRADKLR